MSNLIDIYKFRGIDAFYADSKGNFFTDADGRPIKKEVHEGRLVIRFNPDFAIRLWRTRDECRGASAITATLSTIHQKNLLVRISYFDPAMRAMRGLKPSPVPL